MSVKIIVRNNNNSETSISLPDRNKFFSYQGNGGIDINDRSWLKDELAMCNSATLLEAVFSGSRYSFNRIEPDLDNILLYNMGISTRSYKAVVLEKDISQEKNQPIIYKYSTFEKDLEISESDNNYLIKTCSLNIENRSVESFYRAFRGWLIKKAKTIDVVSLRDEFSNKRLELVIEYNGRYSLSESSFIKPAVDGIISALQTDNTEFGFPNTDLCILTGNSAKNERGWSPMDDLVNKLVVVKTDSDGNGDSIRIKIDSYDKDN